MPTTEKLVPTIEALLTSRIATLEKRIVALEEKLADLAEADKIASLPRALPVSPQPPRSEPQPTEDLDSKYPQLGPATPGGGNGRFEIISVDSRTFERDQDEKSCKFSWKIVVKNLTEDPIVLKALLEFVDMDSYLVEEDTADGFELDPGEIGKFRGYKWISTEAERQIMGVRAHMSEVKTEVEPKDD